MTAPSEVSAQYAGLDVYHARKKIMNDFPGIDTKEIEIRYTESPYPRFTVLKSAYNEKKKAIELEVSSGNPIRHLPSNYQPNEFLRNFLMVFQHILNDTTITLDNMHHYFRPMESPASFLAMLANWLGIHGDTLGGEEETRRFLQCAIPLYRYRGTALGLRAHLHIVCGVVPEIYEGHIPYQAMVIDMDAESEAGLADSEDIANTFTVHFPVLRDTFTDATVQRLSVIVQREKPAHTAAYISFEVPEKPVREVTVIQEDTEMGIDDGITV